VPTPVNSDGDPTVPSKTEEYAVLKYQPDHKDAARDGIVLARLKKVRGKWKVDKKFRRRRAKP
jgi:hypothetical protein